MPSTFLSK